MNGRGCLLFRLECILWILISLRVSAIFLAIRYLFTLHVKKFVQKAFLLGLFLGELIFGGAYYWKEFCVSKLVGLDNKNSYH